MYLKRYKFDLILITLFSVFTIFLKFMVLDLTNAIFLYFIFIIVFKYVLYLFAYTKNMILNRYNFLSLIIWTVIFASLSYPYLILEGTLRLFYLNLYFVFMSLLGLNGYTILIFDLNLKDSLLKTFSKTKLQFFSINFWLGILILNALFFVDLSFDFLILLPVLLYLVTKKYLNFFY